MGQVGLKVNVDPLYICTSICISGCPCHLVHIAAHKAAEKLPIKFEDLLIDIYYYLDLPVITEALSQPTDKQFVHEMSYFTNSLFIK
jgi:hypothetical protein